MDNIDIINALSEPSGKVDAVLDTDAYNEIDDQFAIAYALKSNDKINLKAIYAAPFYNDRATSPKDGMEKSYAEIKKLLALCGESEREKDVYKGSENYLPDEKTPVPSDAASHLIELSRGYGKDKRLYVVAIGAITNVASAILLDKSITERITVVWLGGHSLSWGDTYEFNMFQDVAAARVIFGSGVPVVQLPCMGVVSAFYVTAPELDHYLLGKNALCDYLVENTVQYRGGRDNFWSKVIWDVTAVGWLVGGEQFMKGKLIYAPIPEYDYKYANVGANHFIKYITHVERDALMKDLFEKLSK